MARQSTPFSARSAAIRRRRIRLAALVGALVAVVVVLVASAGGDQQAVVRRFAAAWQRGDYRTMYALLSARARQATSPQAFAAAYRDSELRATAAAVETGRPHSDSSPITLPVTFLTRVFGPLRGRLRVPVSGDGKAARVDWSPTLVFPGLRAGERLTSHLVPAPRGAILAADGVRMSPGPDGSAPAGAAAAEIAGQVTASNARLRSQGQQEMGASGLERLYDRQLAGTAGGQLRAGARLIAHASPRPGRTLTTTVDRHVQAASVSALGSQLGGVAVVRPSDGAVLALAGLALSAPQPPGSTFKLVTAAAALSAGVATPTSTYPVASAATLSGVRLQNAGGESCGGTLANAFAVSCNSVFAPLGARVGARRLVSQAERFGFNERPSLPDAAPSTIPAADKIGDDLAVGSTAIGQGRVQATPLEMATVAAAIANHGLRVAPHLLAGAGGATDRATSLRVATQLTRMMVGVVTSGTGTSAAIPGVTVAGKTGTAELRSTVAEGDAPGQSVSNPKDTDAWFVCFDVDRPRAAIAVMLVGAGAGGASAAPVARQVLTATLSGLG